MPKALKKGDRVAWKTSHGETHGRIVKKQASKTQIKRHKVAASDRNPQFIVQSDTSGKLAAHKPQTLKKIS